MSIESLGRRLLRWAFTVIVASVPFLTTVMVVWLFESLTWSLLTKRSQLLFLPIVLGANALADYLAAPPRSTSWIVYGVTLLTALMALSSAVLYGIHFAGMNISDPENLNLPGFFHAAITMTLCSIVATTIIQARLSQAEPSPHA